LIAGVTQRVSRAFQALNLAAALSVLAWADAGAAGQLATPPAATSSSSKSESVQEVTVRAERAKLAPRVRKFVNGITIEENAGLAGLARWGVPPACPLVSGLPRRDGEFILERLSEIARAARVPLAGEKCRPNLYILITAKPEDLLRGMEKRNRPFTFGYDFRSAPPIETPRLVVDEFIETPRAVRVWYNSNGKDAWGKPLRYCSQTEVDPLCFTNPKDPMRCGMPNDPARTFSCAKEYAGGSHLTFDTVWTFWNVFVIVDQRRLQGVKLGQLADYLAIVAFAKLKPDAHLGDAPTILKLFDGAPQAAPASMTDWDETFLKSLYSTEQKSKQQRGEIARAMVSEIVH
jgi:hypothetical protein